MDRRNKKTKDQESEQKKAGLRSRRYCKEAVFSACKKGKVPKSMAKRYAETLSSLEDRGRGFLCPYAPDISQDPLSFELPRVLYSTESNEDLEKASFWHKSVARFLLGHVHSTSFIAGYFSVRTRLGPCVKNDKYPTLRPPILRRPLVSHPYLRVLSISTHTALPHAHRLCLHACILSHTIGITSANLHVVALFVEQHPHVHRMSS